MANGNNSRLIFIETENTLPDKSIKSIHEARAIFQTTLSDKSRPYVSILVLAYNNLEKYTKYCIESIINNTNNVDYELVLLDNGSTDGTLDYFKSIPHSNKKIIKITCNKGANFGINLATRHLNGRYVAMVPNDVYVTANWLSNMIKCMESEEKIGFVATGSDNISNNQAIDLDFETLEEMQLKAKQYNVSDPKKWEERLRLMPAAGLYRRECLDIIGSFDYAFQHDFSDDDISFRIRRSGYKLMFCGDVFVHHVGPTVTGPDPDQKIETLKSGKNLFKEKYQGLDAWKAVNNFETAMLDLIHVEEKPESSTINILGIEVLCGTPILQLKNKLKRSNIFDIKLNAFTGNPEYWQDLKTICDGKTVIDRPAYLLEHFSIDSFDYILLGTHINYFEEPIKLLKNILSLLKPGGQLLLKLKNQSDLKAFLVMMGRESENTDESLSHLDFNRLIKKLTQSGCEIKSVKQNLHDLDETTQKIVLTALEKSRITRDIESTFNSLRVQEYLINVIKQNDTNKIELIINPHSICDLHEQALIAQKSGNMDGAIKLFKLLIEIDRNNASANNELGILYFQKGEFPKAIQCFHKASTLGPDNFDYKKNIAAVCLELGEVDEAFQLFENILDQSPNDIDVLMSIANLCLSVGLREESQLYVSRVLNIEPENEIAKRLLEG